MALDINGAGFGRTGTYSFKLALKLLGYGACYHKIEVNNNPQGDQIDNRPYWEIHLIEGKCLWATSLRLTGPVPVTGGK